MHYSTVASHALGLAARNTVKSLRPLDEDPSNPAYKTFLAVKETIVTHETFDDKWPSGHSRTAMQYTDKNSVLWSLTIRENEGRLYLTLGHEGNGSNRPWKSAGLEIGAMIQKKYGAVGFHISATFTQYRSWRNGVCMNMPETRACRVVK